MAHLFFLLQINWLQFSRHFLAFHLFLAVFAIMASRANDDRKAKVDKVLQESAHKGFKAAAISCVLITVPTLIAVRKIPWAKANINHAGQALIICGGTIASYFITVDKNILKTAKEQARYDNTT